MFSKAVACGALLCALLGPVIAGEARALPGRHRQLVNQHLQLGRSAQLLQAEARKPAWPSARPSLKQPAAGPSWAGVDGRLGDAFMVDTGVVPIPLLWGMYFSYGAASNGDGWRVFWADDNSQSVYTSGIGSDGSVTDGVGNRVGQELYAAQGLVSRAIAGTGSGFTAVWTAGDNRSVWSARLDSAGNVLDSLLVFDSDQGQIYPAIAFDGDSTCLVAWMDHLTASCDIYAARLTVGGRLLDSVPFPIARDSTKMEVCPTVAFGHGVYLVAWTAIDTLSSTATAKAVRVSEAGQVLDTAIFLRHDPGVIQMYPNVAFGDTCFLATWSEGMEQPDIFAVRVSASGNLMDTAAIQLCSDPDMDMFSSIGFNGTDYLVMWEEIGDVWPSGSLCGRRLTADGVPLDSVLTRPGMKGYVCTGPSVSQDQENFFVACNYTDTTVYNFGVCCLRISPEGAVLDSGICLPLGADWQYEPSGASDGTDFLAVWLEDQAQGSAVSAARITADGTVLDPVGFPVDTAPTSKSYPATAFGDSVYLAAWGDNRGATGLDIYCARIGMDGHVLDPDGIVVCSETLDQDYPDISFDGENFLVAWHDNRSDMRGNIYAARVSPTGAVLDPNGFAVAVSDSFDDAAPAVCFTGTDHLVVWQGYSYNASDDNIYGALVSPGGTITRPRYMVGSTANAYPPPPSAARGAANSLVAWVQDNGAIYAARVRADGTVLDTSALLVDKTNEYNELPHVTADADGFRVLWDNYDMDSTRFAVARIDTAGNLVRSDAWFTAPSYQFGFDAVDGGGPDLLVLFSCWTEAVLGRRYSAYRLWGRLGAVPGIQEISSQQAKRVAGGATIVRGVLYVSGRASSSPRTILLDISGRRVLDLKPGANDVRGLAPGVYFVRETSGVKRAASSVSKVVLTE